MRHAEREARHVKTGGRMGWTVDEIYRRDGATLRRRGRHYVGAHRAPEPEPAEGMTRHDWL